jgi:hypothetical protein
MMLKEELETTLASQGTYLKQAWNEPEKESTYSFLGDDEEGRCRQRCC